MTFPKDTMAAKIAFYGDPRGVNGVNPKWFADNIVKVTPPYKMFYAGKPIKTISFHKKCAPALKAALDEIWDACNHDQKIIEKNGMHEFGGSFNYRLIRGSGNLSNHSFGIAIDINVTGNELGKTKGDMPKFAIAAFKRQGFKWGGDYSGRKDWMHFEAVFSGVKPSTLFEPAEPPEAGVDDGDASTVDDAGVSADEDTPNEKELQTVRPVTGNPAVLDIQKRLKAMKYNPGGIDGLWGGMTAGALTGFLTDRNKRIPAPTSLDTLAPVLDEIKDELSEAESEDPPFTRPVSDARANADQKKIEEAAPEVVPVKRNFLVTVWGSIVAFFAAAWDTIASTFGNLFGFVTDHKDDVPEEAKSGLFSILSDIPPIVWLLTVGGLLAFIGYNSWSSIKKTTEQVKTGERL